MYRAVHPHDGSAPMDRPCQSDSFAGYMEGHIIGIACESVGAPSIIMRGRVDHNNNIRTILQVNPDSRCEPASSQPDTLFEGRTLDKLIRVEVAEVLTTTWLLKECIDKK